MKDWLLFIFVPVLFVLGAWGLIFIISKIIDWVFDLWDNWKWGAVSLYRALYFGIIGSGGGKPP